MVERNEARPSGTVLHKRKNKGKKHHDSKRMKVVPGMGKKNKISQRKQKLFRKRAREYNSDEEEETIPESTGVAMDTEKRRKFRNDEGEEDHDVWKEKNAASDDEVVIPTGITRFIEGSKAFGIAFQAIMKSQAEDETLGPVLAARKNLVVSKLAEEDAERKAKGEAKKEKHTIEEMGHKKPANFLDAHEKFLIGVATKGVVKLFNAVNKAQNAQKGLNPSRFKDAKALTKRRKEVFFSELGKTSAKSDETTAKVSARNGGEDDSQPAWAPLRDTFMLTNSKLKDWDKMAVRNMEFPYLSGIF